MSPRASRRRAAVRVGGGEGSVRNPDLFLEGGDLATKLTQVMFSISHCSNLMVRLLFFQATVTTHLT